MTEPNPSEEEIQERFSRVFHREMNSDELRCFHLGNRCWILGYLVGMESAFTQSGLNWPLFVDAPCHSS
jgi:hypothetical protein